MDEEAAAEASLRRAERKWEQTLAAANSDLSLGGANPFGFANQLMRNAKAIAEASAAALEEANAKRREEADEEAKPREAEAG